MSGVAAIAAAAVGASGAVTVIDGVIHHPRDEAAFQGYLVRYIGGHADSSNPGAPARDTAWAMAHPDEALAAGNTACDWLESQPRAAMLDPTGATAFHAVITQYLDTLRPISGPVSDTGTMSIVAGAWAYLCWTDRELRTAPMSTSPD